MSDLLKQISILLVCSAIGTFFGNSNFFRLFKIEEDFDLLKVKFCFLLVLTSIILYLISLFLS